MNERSVADAATNDASARDPFVAYYERESISAETHRRFTQTRDLILKVQAGVRAQGPLRVADIGCGAGTFSRIWAESGCVVSGIDVNADLIDIARKRTVSAGLRVEYFVGTAQQLPWESDTFDIVMLPELLEHVEDWHGCLQDSARVLRKGGVLYVSTSNWLCPVQHEYDLPLYSWYPAPVKRRCVQLALTKHPEWVSHAKYPAIHWFSPYSLGRVLSRLGLEVLDRFDLIALHSEGRRQKVARVIRAMPPLKFLGHVMTPYTQLVGRKR